MNDEKEQAEQRHLKIKKIMTIVGAAMLLVGLILIIVFFIDFVRSVSSSKFGPPELFWLSFIGFPMAAIGGSVLLAARRGDIAKFSMRENSTVVNEYSERIAPAARNFASAAREGFLDDADKVVCAKCGEKSDSDAAFCTACGAELKTVCNRCGGKNDANAKFCKHCGEPFGKEI
jgi:ribosomal protein L40E